MTTDERDNDNRKETAVFVRFTLREHLTRLEAIENEKPPAERRHVPSLSELSQSIGISRQGIYKLATGKTGAVSFVMLSALISELRRWGFSTDVSDLLTAYPS